MKTTVHIISHSHWDREWYQSFEKHRMKLIELVDNILEKAENDPEFGGFFLDGQTIALDDYLEVRPEKREQRGGRDPLRLRRRTRQQFSHVPLPLPINCRFYADN